jgi:hypothetical protein
MREPSPSVQIRSAPRPHLARSVIGEAKYRYIELPSNLTETRDAITKGEEGV